MSGQEQDDIPYILMPTDGRSQHKRSKPQLFLSDLPKLDINALKRKASNELPMFTHGLIAPSPDVEMSDPSTDVFPTDTPGLVSTDSEVDMPTMAADTFPTHEPGLLATSSQVERPSVFTDAFLTHEPGLLATTSDVEMPTVPTFTVHQPPVELLPPPDLPANFHDFEDVPLDLSILDSFFSSGDDLPFNDNPGQVGDSLTLEPQPADAGRGRSMTPRPQVLNTEGSVTPRPRALNAQSSVVPRPPVPSAEIRQKPRLRITLGDIFTTTVHDGQVLPAINTLTYATRPYIMPDQARHEEDKENNANISVRDHLPNSSSQTQQAPQQFTPHATSTAGKDGMAPSASKPNNYTMCGALTQTAVTRAPPLPNFPVFVGQENRFPPNTSGGGVPPRPVRHFWDRPEPTSMLLLLNEHFKGICIDEATNDMIHLHRVPDEPPYVRCTDEDIAVDRVAFISDYYRFPDGRLSALSLGDWSSPILICKSCGIELQPGRHCRLLHRFLN